MENNTGASQQGGNISKTPIPTQTANPATNVSAEKAVQQIPVNEAEVLKETLKQTAPAFRPEVVTFTCSIRRKPGLVGLPGADPNERNYKIGSSYDKGSRGTLRGITGELETLLMPNMVAINHNAFEFRQAIEEYWQNISIPIPADHENFKDHEQGRICNIKFMANLASIKDTFNSKQGVQAKIEYLQQKLITPIEGVTGVAGQQTYQATLDYDSIADFLLLSYSLKYSRVANDYTDIHNSGKIMFYLYEKSTAISSKLSLIQNMEKASKLFVVVQDNALLLNSLLLEFGENPNLYDTIEERIIVLHEAYTKDRNSIDKFIKAAEDGNWETKYLIKSAVANNKLKNPPNTESYYYNDQLLGSTLEAAVLKLNNDTEEMNTLKRVLQQELNLITS